MTLAQRASRLSPWARLVLGCAVIVGAAAVALTAWTLASEHERRVSYPVVGRVDGLELDLAGADLEVQGAGRRTSVSVQHVDHYGFGHAPTAERSVAGGVLRLRARCPRTILHACSVRYRIAVPDNVPLTVVTTTGTVRLHDYRGTARVTTDGGDIAVDGYCGFSLQARAGGDGDVTVRTVCPPPRMSLRTATGTVRAQVPPARYSIDASTGGPPVAVRGLQESADAPFSIQALSGTGAVVVERAS